MAKIKGICRNDDCDLAAERVIQEVEKSNFVCEECGKPLVPFGNISDGDKNKWKKKAAIVVAALAVLGGGGFALSQMGGSEEKAPEAINKVDTAKVDSVKAETATAKAEPVSEPVKPEAEKKEETKPAPEKTQPAAPKGPSVSWGKYTGPANGLGGTIRVTKSYTLDLNSMDGDVLELNPGDEIQNTQFKNGQLRGGVWVHGGKRRFFNR